uniref:Uncharacterized protein n=1 Tax=Rhizophora mucronata TaxID=61149 RepID=A0A2P2M418_RHIMU
MKKVKKPLKPRDQCKASSCCCRRCCWRVTTASIVLQNPTVKVSIIIPSKNTHNPP